MELQHELLAQRDAIGQKLKAINLLIGVEMNHPVKTGRSHELAKAKAGHPRARRLGKVTTNDAILEVLDDGQLAVKEITLKVKALKGKVSKASINGSLTALKKVGKITSPARGQYALKK